MFANIAHHTATIVSGFNGASLLLVVAIIAPIWLRATFSTVRAVPHEYGDRPRHQCRPCRQHEHTHPRAPHTDADGTPCECACATPIVATRDLRVVR